MKYKRHCLFTPFHFLSLPFAPLLLFFIFQFSIFNFTVAQPSNFTVQHQQQPLLPSHVESISFLDSNIYFYVSSPDEGAPGVLLKAQCRNNTQFSFLNAQLSADTVLVKLDEDINYVVRHPSTGDLYFTTLDRKGRSYLYRCHVDENGKQKIKQVKMDGGFLSKGMNVFHPTFTADGKVMVFSSSKEDIHRGSLDLWYSRYNGEEWGDLTNLGYRINTNGNEINPFIYNGCLLFASNGNADDNGHYALYATRLYSDSVGHRLLGRCLVQRLPEPFNIAGTDNLALSSFTSLLSPITFLISNRDLSSHTIHRQSLFTLDGTLEGMLLWGTVTDRYDHPLPGVKIDALQNSNIVCSATTDDNGRYRIYLRCGQQYELSYRLPNYFVTTEPFSTSQGEEGYLITEKQHNIKLDGLPVGQRFHLDDLFGPDADIQLSPHGIETLAPLVRFLTDNPNAKVTLSLSNDLTEDPSFNSLLTESRIRSLEKHLRESLPKTVDFNIFSSCDGSVKCATGTGSSILTILIDN